jgi:curved DNA-binding protein CbpA
MIGRRTYYQILQVDQAADSDIISTVYRRLAKRYHPDADPSPEAHRQILELNEAYETLSDPERRARYDAQLAVRRDRRATDRLVRRVDPDYVGGGERLPFGEAGPPPPGPTRGIVLDFGRYRGWTLAQVAQRDMDFLEWLRRSPAGRNYRAELDQLLGPRR